MSSVITSYSISGSLGVLSCKMALTKGPCPPGLSQGQNEWYPQETQHSARQTINNQYHELTVTTVYFSSPYTLQIPPAETTLLGE